MRKLTLAPKEQRYAITLSSLSAIIFLLLSIPNILNSQCSPQANTLSGSIYIDANFNGSKELSEDPQGNVLVRAYDGSGTLAGENLAAANGFYSITGLSNGSEYRLEFILPAGLEAGPTGNDNGSVIQFAQAPACNLSLGVTTPDDYCEANPRIGLSCFARGNDQENTTLETLVGLEHYFNPSSPVSKFAMKSETGNVWGVAWKQGTQELFSSAFVKQYASLSSHGPGAIFKTKFSRTGKIETELFFDLGAAGIDVGTLSETDPNNCDYGAQTGKMGLGAMVISPDEDHLYIVNINNNSLVRIPSANPTPADVEEYFVSDPGCPNGDFRIFALTEHEGLYYVGGNCTGETAKDSDASSAVIFEFDPGAKSYNNVFETNYFKGFWADFPPARLDTSHWLTDLAFTDEGNMVMGYASRLGHRYCNDPTAGRVDQQFPDILMVWDNNGTWTLENNGTAGVLAGTGIGNMEGPGGGEFFGDDYWTTNAAIHPEIALGSLLSHGGTGEVIAAVYDPIDEAYSGGLHRYSTSTGAKQNAIELYTRSLNDYFGKATGFGDIVTMCGEIPIEIGNFVWVDSNDDGIQDPGEEPLTGLEISLYDTNCQLVGTTITDENGEYYFNDSNVDLDLDGTMDGLEYASEYHIVISDPRYNMSNLALEVDGKNYIMTVRNATKGDKPDLVDNDFLIDANGCGLVDGKPHLTITTGNSGETNHSFDLGVTENAIFDLALIKTLQDNSLVRDGQTIGFDITIFNQGNVIAKDIVVSDHFRGAYIFNEGINPGWKSNGVFVKAKVPGELKPGESTTIEIFLTIQVPDALSELINIAEISAANDQFGNPGDDIDSTPDEDPDNDAGGIPNSPNTDDTIDLPPDIDEDDHDAEMVNLLDLALMKVIGSDQEFFMPGELVPFLIQVYNQGTQTAKEIKVVDFIPKGFVFESNLNPGWVMDSDTSLMYAMNVSLQTAEAHDISLNLRIDPKFPGTVLINTAEIADFEDEETGLKIDFDSEANHIEGDDVGGDPDGPTNDEIFLRPPNDEDDHDREKVIIQHFDLALYKTTDETLVLPGELVDFTVHVVNQGTITADNIQLVDYIPAEASLVDPDWSIDPENPDHALTTLSIAEGTLPPLGLLPLDTFEVNITLKVDDFASPGNMDNYSEILGATDLFGLEMNDEDSNYDNQNTDTGAVPGTPTDDETEDDGDFDEDDHDVARVYISNSEISILCDCSDNATTEDNGQFDEELKIYAPAGQTWFIQEVVGLFQSSSPAPPDPPAPFSTGPAGDTFTEGDPGEYTLEGIHIDGQGYTLVAKNMDGETIQFSNPGCSYAKPQIDGPDGVCELSTIRYEVVNPNPTSTYIFIVNGPSVGGVVTGETYVDVDWTAPSVGNEIILIEDNEDDCYAPVTLFVEVGVSAGAIACVGPIQTSLDESCQVVVTPEMLMAGAANEDAVFTVMLMDQNGNIIPGNILTEEHIGYVITGKLIDDCGGNSCWTTIEVEDKIDPVIICNTVEIECYTLPEYAGPQATDNCDTNVEIIQVDQDIIDLSCESDIHSKQVIRTYQAIDDYGNISETCTQNIFLKRIQLDDIVFPDSLLIRDNRALTCGAYPKDGDGFPDPVATGVPTIGGVPLYPFNFDCNIAVERTDTEIPTADCTKKFMRVWTVYEWRCEELNQRTEFQIIEVIDAIPPVVSCPEDVTMTSNGEECGSYVYIPALEPSDNCSETFRVDVQFPGGYWEDQNGGVVFLPVGEHEIIYTVYDECHNFVQCDYTVRIKDITPPVAICDLYTAVGLSLEGYAEVYAFAFDNGSYDDCEIDRMEVKRIDDVTICDESDYHFGPTVTFCCEDVGPGNMVVLRVYDKAGNYNECMVNVTVQDKFEPEITCPPDMTISCHDIYDLEDLSAYGLPTVIDQCDITINEFPSENVNSCGVGYIQRVFVAEDQNNSSSCVQRIYIKNPDPFTKDDITWPEDFTTNQGCDAGDLMPENLSPPFDQPVIFEDECDLVGVSYKDHTFPITENNACLKILRRWKVIDWCQQDEEGNHFIEEWTQVIKVNDLNPPMITLDPPDITVCAFDDNCEGENISGLVATASDVCTPDELLRWEYKIDYHIDNFIDDQMNGNGNTINLNGFHPIGIHSIVYTFEDRCGNKVSIEQIINIENCKAPIAACIDGIAVNIEPMDLDGDGAFDTEMAFICAEQFDASSIHPCGFPIVFSFGPDTTNVCMPVDCNDVGEQTVTICVTETVFGNQACCETTLDIQDNNDVDECPSLKDCLIFDEEITFEGCLDPMNPDYSPENLGSVLMIDPDCFCDDYTINDPVDNFTTNPDGCTVIERSWTVTFLCTGFPQSVTCEQTITILNDMDPMIFCPSDVTVNAGPDCDAEVNISTPDFEADCNTGVTLTHNYANAFDPNGPNASGIYPVGTTPVIFTVSDECGNSAQCTVMVTVKDVTPPEIMCPSNLTIDCGDPIVPLTLYGMATATDACGTPSIEELPAEFDLDDCGLGTIKRTFVATDGAGLTAMCMQIITVDLGDDPIGIEDISIVPDTVRIVECDPDDLSTDPPIVDTGDAACFNIGIGDPIDESLSNGMSCPDTIIRTWVVVDSCQLEPGTMNGIFEIEQVLIIEDTEAPVLTVPDDLTLYVSENTCDIFANLPFDVADCDPTVADNGTSNDSPFADNMGATGDASGTYPPGVYNITVTAEDACENGSMMSYVLTVKDTFPPVCIVDDITIFLDEFGMATIDENEVGGSSSDNCSEMITLQLDKSDYDCEDIGVQTFKLFVIDEFMNIDSCEAMVTVKDDIPPTLECPANMVVDCGEVSLSCDEITNEILDQLFGTPTFSDICFDTLIQEFECELNICGVGEITRTFTVLDLGGNSVSCTQTITITLGDDPISQEDISFSAEMDTVTITDCNPMNIVTDPPDVNTDGADCFRIGIADPVDESLSNGMSCPDTLIRTWTVIDSCQLLPGTSNGIFEIEQVLIIDDTDAPILTVPDDLTLYVGETTCDVFANLPFEVEDCDPTVADNGSSNDSPFADNMGATGDASGTYPPGVYNITVTAEDVCENSTMDSYILTVKDTFPPVCIADDITLYLDETGVATLPDTVGNNSFDNCSLDLMFEIDPVDYACNDISPDPRTYSITVTDEFGNFSTCTGSVQIKDTIPPVLICPPDLTVGCDELDLDNLSLYGIALPTTESNLWDACPLSSDSITVINLDEVCGIGEIIRTWTRYDRDSNFVTCSQIITVDFGPDPFGLDNIIFTMDTVFIDNCVSLDPDDLPGSAPVIDFPPSICTNIEVVFEDTDLTDGPACPDTILRVWTVLDSCQFVEGTSNGMFVFPQVLVIDDSTPPVLTVPGDMMLSADADTCNLFIDLPFMVEDCDMNVTTTNDSPFADNMGATGDASGVYPPGEHTITVTAVDNCMNVTTDSYTITIVDDLPPEFTCFKVIAGIEDDGQIIVDVDTLTATLSDNCADSITMAVSFSKVDPTVTSMTYDCAFLEGLAMKDDTLFLYAFDDFMNIDSCKTIITVVDPMGFCGNALVTADLEGSIYTEQNEFLGSVIVELEGSGLAPKMTGDNGAYAFPTMPLGGAYTIKPLKDINPLNGVSTLDIIFIQKHILGLDLFDSPYQHIAADINDSKSVTASDMLELRKLILGVNDDFPDNTSWKTIPADYEFYDLEYPLQDDIPLSYEIPSLSESIEIDFIGVKIGDINGNAIPNDLLQEETEVRTNPMVVVFDVDEADDGIQRIKVYPSNEEEISGFQFTLEFPAAHYSFFDLKAGVLDLGWNNIGLRYEAEGLITFSWNSNQMKSVDTENPLFELEFVNIKQGSGWSDWSIGSKITKMEAYTGSGTRDIGLSIRETELNEYTFELLQNRPNPWTSSTKVEFTLPGDMEAEINIYDVTGKRLMTIKDRFKAGYNQVDIHQESLGSQGLLYYELRTSERSMMNKMLLIR